MSETKFRVESDLLGELQVPENAYYGVQTQRAINNYQISATKMSDYPEYVIAMGYVKKAAALANEAVGQLDHTIADAMVKACDEIIAGKLHENFPVDMMQGGAGTSVNMNANEVVANRALEIMGHQKGEYKFCSPNDHANMAQSTNDAYPTAIKLGVLLKNKNVIAALERLIKAFYAKAEEFKDYVKMGRTQLQDAVPMTLGQSFTAFAHQLENEVKYINANVEGMLCQNMGGTAIGTGLNAAPGFTEKCTEYLAQLTGMKFYAAEDLIADTNCTTDYVAYHGALKRLAVQLSKICNDLRLMASGPRTGLHEINLPAMAPGSSIMPGKVNPVIPEVTNQVCFKVIGNDTAVAFAAEAGQLELNVMEPVIMQCMMESMTWLEKVMDTLRVKCVEGITANPEHCRKVVMNSIGIVTALNPYIGYKGATKIAKEALATGKSVAEIALEQTDLTKEKIEEILDPMDMISVHKFHK